MSDYFLADDLSGALDAAAAFHRAGRRVKVVLSPQEWPDADPEEIVGITTETRNLTASVAAETVVAAIRAGHDRGTRLVYKKIDSTLRGPVAAELAALAVAMPGTRFLFAPANPRVGRIVRAGQLLVHGVPLAKTEFARDPLSPVRDSSIPLLLGGAAGPQVTIADAETDADLAAAVQRMESLGEPWVAIGSGALAHPVAALHRGTSPVTRTNHVTPARGPMIFVCGSAHECNRVQAHELARECDVPLREIRPADMDAVTRTAIADVARQGAVSLIIDSERIESAKALHAVARVAYAVATETRATSVFATGGETAFAVCRALGVSCLTFQEEIEPGVSLARADGSLGAMYWVVKPGGFGDARTWSRAFRALRGCYFI